MVVNRGKWVRLILAVGLVLALDRVSKNGIMTTLQLGQTVQPIPAFAPFFQFTYIRNPGAAFGLLPQAGDIFLVIAALVVIAMVVVYPRISARAVLTQIALGMVMGGAVGNAIDRLTHDAVIDFIHYQVSGLFSNVSNIADHAIVLGVLILFVQSWRTDQATTPSGAAPIAESDEP